VSSFFFGGGKEGHRELLWLRVLWCCVLQTVVRGSTWSPYSTSPTSSPTGHGWTPPQSTHPHLQSYDHDPRFGSYSPSHRQDPLGAGAGGSLRQYPASQLEPTYRGPPSDIGERRDYRDLAQYGRNGYRGNGSVPQARVHSSLDPIGRPSSALSDLPYQHHQPAFHSQLQPQYSNGSFNGPGAPTKMESPPRPGMNRTAGPPRGVMEDNDRDRLYQQTMSANQQYERVCGALLPFGRPPFPPKMK